MAQHKPDVLDLLIRHELAIKELYEIFAVKFPEHLDLWKRLADDEQRHGDLLTTLRGQPTLEAWLLRDSPLKPQAIQTSTAYVESQIARAREGKLTLLQALSIGRDLESALLEKQLGKLGESHSPQIRSVMSALTSETAGHREALAQAIGTQARKGP